MLNSVHRSLHSATLKNPFVEETTNNRVKKVSGLLIATLIVGLWLTSLTILLSVEVDKLPIWLIPFAMGWQMFLYTGLFITAHDAMHGLVFPQKPKINNLVGSVVVIAYGLFSYKKLLQKHWLHHNYPASDRDPDFHHETSVNPILWYFHFMKGYWHWQQFLGLTLLYHFAHSVLQIPENNLILFWMLPSILSSVQLFYFGTFLPHKEPIGGYTNSHRAETISLPTFWSFITCYHFGYHEEHHEFPHVPWWQLSKVHKSWVYPGFASGKKIQGE